jgi:hypothetical protein
MKWLALGILGGVTAFFVVTAINQAPSPDMAMRDIGKDQSVAPDLTKYRGDFGEPSFKPNPSRPLAKEFMYTDDPAKGGIIF